MRMVVVLFSLVVGLLWASPVNTSNRRDFQGLQAIISEYIRNHTQQRDIPDWIKLPILPKRGISYEEYVHLFGPGRRAISLADFIMNNPPKNVFDPDKKRQNAKRVLPAVDPAVLQHLIDMYTHMPGLRDLSDKRETFFNIPVFPNVIEEYYKNHPELVFPGRRSAETLNKRVVLDKALLQQILLHSAPDLSIINTLMRSTENMLNKRVFYQTSVIQQILHDHPELLNINNLLRSTENLAGKRESIGPVYTNPSVIPQFDLNPEIIFPFNFGRAAENRDERDIIETAQQLIHNLLSNLNFRSTESEADKRAITLDPDWVNHIKLPNGMTLQQASQLYLLRK